MLGAVSCLCIRVLQDLRLILQLLAQPIQNTLSQLTQTIRFLVANDMLQGVELNPGDAEEQAREAGKISMVVEGGDVEISLTEGSKAVAVVEEPVLDSQ
jgi:Tfp pilus assembly protein PilV